VPLLVGGTVLIIYDANVKQPEKFLAVLSAKKITMPEVVPAYLSVLLSLWEGPHLNSLVSQYLIVTGEILYPKLAQQWLEKFSNWTCGQVG
jgi:acyl-coenzyme A synthetase/AMP-(fatty) acid ligase